MTDLDAITTIDLIRVGPVYLWWSEYDDAAVIGPKDGAWGGDNIYRCDSCPEWQSEGDEDAHAQRHGFYVAFHDERRLT